MDDRCRNSNRPQWKDWGGRGIKVCKRWDSFANFAADMGPHPGKGWSLDRRNNDGDYRPGNCRWTNRVTQNRNRRYGAKRRLTLAEAVAIRLKDRPGTGRHNLGNRRELAKEYGVSFETIRDIVNNRAWL
jgi:hypothetical protein